MGDGEAPVASSLTGPVAPPPSEPVEVPGAALPLGLAAALYGSYRWAERRLFELTGAWAAEATIPAVAVHLDEVSAGHAWHADLWRDRLPVLDGWDHERLTRPFTQPSAELFEALGATGARTVERLSALYRVVLPRLLVTYRRHSRATAEVADAPAIRVLRLVRDDERESWEAGEQLLEELLVSNDASALAGAVQVRLESVLTGPDTGGGLFPWPRG